MRDHQAMCEVAVLRCQLQTEKDRAKQNSQSKHMRAIEEENTRLAAQIESLTAEKIERLQAGLIIPYDTKSELSSQFIESVD